MKDPMIQQLDELITSLCKEVIELRTHLKRLNAIVILMQMKMGGPPISEKEIAETIAAIDEGKMLVDTSDMEVLEA